MTIHIDVRKALAKRPKEAVHASLEAQYYCPNCGTEVRVRIEAGELKGQRTGIPCASCDKTFTAQWDFTDVSLN